MYKKLTIIAFILLIIGLLLSVIERMRISYSYFTFITIGVFLSGIVLFIIGEYKKDKKVLK